MCPNYQSKKRFGQNFLTDENIIQQIINIIDPQYVDNLVEIGPGRGALTERLLNFCPRLRTVEIDRDLVRSLKRKFEHYKKFTETSIILNELCFSDEIVDFLTLRCYDLLET